MRVLVRLTVSRAVPSTGTALSFPFEWSLLSLLLLSPFTADPGRARALDVVLDVPIASAPGQGSGFGRWEPVDLVSTALSLELQELSLVVPLVA